MCTWINLVCPALICPWSFCSGNFGTHDPVVPQKSWLGMAWPCGRIGFAPGKLGKHQRPDMRLMRSDSIDLFQTCSNFQLCFGRINAETTGAETRMFFVLIFCFKFKVDFLPLLLEVTVMPWVSMLEDPNFLSSGEPMELNGTGWNQNLWLIRLWYCKIWSIRSD